MSLFKEMKSRQIQRKANSFIESLKKKSEKEIEQAYLDNKEFENNEIVLSYLFFNHVNLIRILPIDFQISRINSNLSMFNYGSEEARKQLVSSWVSENKLFMNALVVGFSDEEYNEYLKLYFNQPDDIALLYMEDLKKVITALSNSDLKKTEELLNKIKDKITDRQWEYVIEVNPSFIKYASEEVQNKYSDDERYTSYLSGSARNKYISSQVEKIKSDISLLDNMDVDVQREYVKEHPYMINFLSESVLINVLKYDSELLKYANFSLNKNKEDKTQEVVCGILENIETKSNKELVNILVSKCLLNAKGKIYRFDPNSNDISYQYTKRIIKLFQKLTINQIITLVMIDVNYILPYVIPVYNSSASREEKEKIVIDCNSRCLNVFKEYFNDELYSKYYKLINKIYNEYLSNIDKYDYSTDYRCIFELLKILFNKKIIEKNNFEKVSLFIGTSIMYKDGKNDTAKKACIKLLNDILSTAYDTTVDNNREIYNINSLELFDKKLSFISKELLNDFSKYNFVNISNLLLIIKSDNVYELFKLYYQIIVYIYGENKESLYRAIENFNYYKDILKDTYNQDLNSEELDNLSILLTTFNNPNKIRKRSELANYSIIQFKKLVSELSSVKDENVYKNILCNYLFNKGYDDRGNTGWLEADTIISLCDMYDVECVRSLTIDNEKIFDKDEVDLFIMTKLLFSVDDFDLLLSFVENIISNKVKRNILSVSELFNKIKKFRIELINNEIVSLEEIEDLYIARPDMVIKNKKDGIDIYTVVGQDFRVLCSSNDDGIHYDCIDVSKLTKNVYAYDELVKEGSIRFTTEDDKTIIKVNKDNINSSNMKAKFIIVVSKLTDELINVAKENNLKIVEVQE